MDVKGQNAKSDRAQRLLLLLLCIPVGILLLSMLFSEFVPLEGVVLDRMLIGYCVALLALLSGVRLGGVLASGAATGKILWPVLGAPLLALLVVAVPFSFGIAVLIVAFGAQGAWDSWSGFRGTLSREYAASRRLMTWIITTLLIAILVLHGLVNAQNYELIFSPAFWN